MLRKSFIFSVIILSFLIALFFSKLFYISKNDLKMFDMAQQKNSFEKAQTTHLQSIGVKEDIFITDSDERKHFVIFSEYSSVFLIKNHQKYDLTKHLDKITFSNEEIVNKNIKHIRFITAENGIYLFPYKLTLNNINLSFAYQSTIPSKDFQTQYFSGKAKKLYFSADKKKPIMEVDNFDGNFTPVKGIKCKK